MPNFDALITNAAPATSTYAGAARTAKDSVGVAFIGAGNYAKGVLLPALAKCKATEPISLVTATGPSARRSAERFGFASCATDSNEALRDVSVDLVFVTQEAVTHDFDAAVTELPYVFEDPLAFDKKVDPREGPHGSRVRGE